MKFNPLSEVNYRKKLARNFLKEAKQRFSKKDYRGTVESAQLATENAEKTIIATYRIPSWSHDPSAELMELLNKFP